jgi:ADP-heptose:LPS heptosyltransferase
MSERPLTVSERSLNVNGRSLIVALRPLGLGDLLTGLPALRALRAAFPEHRLVLAAPEALAPLARLTGAVDAVVHTEPLRPLPAELHGAAVAVDLHGRGPGSHRALLASRPARLLAFANPAVVESRGMPAWRACEHEVDRWCRMLAEHGIPADPDDLALDVPPLRAPAGAEGATLIHPGAASPARRWPAARYAAVARAERASGRRVIVTGGPDEVALARRVAGAAGLGDEAVLAGRTTLVQLAALVAAAGRVVCGDTGVAHLATALGTPSVVLFGPVPPTLWGPPERPRHRVLWAGSTGDPHGADPDPGLLALRVDDVVGALADLERKEVAA